MTPPTAVTERSPRDRLLDAADTLMHLHGYEAVGVAELCRLADTRKGSFYHFFESKQTLAIEMLERSWQRTRDGILADTVANPALDAIEAFTEYGNRLADRMQAQLDLDDVVPGCRFGNFAVELSTRDHEIRDHIAGIFDAMVEMTASMVRRSIDAGSLDPDTDAAAAARQLIAIMEGRMVLAKAAADPDLLRELGADAERLLH